MELSWRSESQWGRAALVCHIREGQVFCVIWNSRCVSLQTSTHLQLGGSLLQRLYQTGITWCDQTCNSHWRARYFTDLKSSGQCTPNICIIFKLHFTEILIFCVLMDCLVHNSSFQYNHSVTLKELIYSLFVRCNMWFTMKLFLNANLLQLGSHLTSEPAFSSSEVKQYCFIWVRHLPDSAEHLL